VTEIGRYCTPACVDIEAEKPCMASSAIAEMVLSFFSGYD